jgi:hypothetical protein
MYQEEKSDPRQQILGKEKSRQRSFSSEEKIENTEDLFT